GRGINIHKVLEIEALAAKHGFELAGMRAFDKAITDEQVAHTRELAIAARAGVAPVDRKGRPLQRAAAQTGAAQAKR
ncbi:MAG: hypothetical protein ACHQY2_07800, partial [Candidatus Eremiobacterales bacterium]